MQYFKHQSNMRHDVKIKRVINKYGLEGYGLYNLIVESITESLSTNSPLPDLQENCEDIAEFYNGNTTKINEMTNYMVNQGLFDIDELSGHIFCSKVYKFLDTSQTRSEQLRDMIKNYKEVSKLKMLEFDDSSQFVSDSLRQDNTVSDFPDRREEEEKKKRTEKNRKELHTENNSQPFETYTGKPEQPDQPKSHTEISRDRIKEIKHHWKSLTILPQSRALDTNTSHSSNLLDVLNVFPNEDIIQAMNHLSESYPKIDAKYRIKSFSNFMTVENVEKWYPDQIVEKDKEPDPVYKKGSIKWN